MQLPLHSPVCATCAKEASACSCSAPDHGQELVTLLADAKEPCSLDDGMALWAMHLDVHPMTCAFSARDFLTQLTSGGSFHKGLERVLASAARLNCQLSRTLEQAITQCSTCAEHGERRPCSYGERLC